VRELHSVAELRNNCRIIEATQCWQFLKEDGSEMSEKTVPTLGRPPKQVAVIAVELSGRCILPGWTLRRMHNCIRFCCNPNHIFIVKTKRGERKGEPSNNPKGNPAALLPNAGRAKGTPRPYRRGKPTSNPWGRAGKPETVRAE